MPATATDSVPGRGGAAPTTVPSAPSPQSFRDRADIVAAAVRRAGVPTTPKDPILLGGWTVDEGFDTNAQKVAWNLGHVRFGAGVDADRTSTARLRLPDGSTPSVAVVGARPALDRALLGALGSDKPCEGIPADECHLTITKVMLGDASVPTHLGSVRVPVWRLTIEGLSHPISVIAVADGALGQADSPTPPPGLPDPDPVLKAADSLRAVDGSSITVGIGHGACDANLKAHVVEFDDLVVAGATADPVDPNQMCTSIYLSGPATLRLARPLGDRVVIDVVSGTPRFLGVPFT